MDVGYSTIVLMSSESKIVEISATDFSAEADKFYYPVFDYNIQQEYTCSNGRTHFLYVHAKTSSKSSIIIYNSGKTKHDIIY